MLTPQEKKVVWAVAIGVTVSVIGSILLCGCGALLGFVLGFAKELAKGAGG